MFTIRIQNKLGLGPYCVSREDKAKAVCDLQDAHNADSCSTKHPSPVNDVGINRFPEPDESCGFLNYQQLYNWFTEKELDILRKAEFHIMSKKTRGHYLI